MKIDLDKVAAIKSKDNRENEEWTSPTKGEPTVRKASKFNFWKPLYKRDYDLYWVEFTLKNGYEIRFLVPESEIEQEAENEQT